MGIHQRAPQGCQIREICFVNDELVGVSSCFREDCYSLTAPDQLSATLAEALPAAMDKFVRLAVHISVPAFHRKNAKSVRKWKFKLWKAIGSCKRGIRTGLYSGIKVKLDTERLDVLGELFGSFKLGNAFVSHGNTKSPDFVSKPGPLWG